MQNLQLETANEPHSTVIVQAPGQLQPLMEQRAHPRLPVQGDAEILLHDGVTLIQGRILNITPSGCFVQTLDLARLLPFTRAEILFRVNGKMVRIAAEVRFATPRSGVGLRFLDAGGAIQAILDTIQAHRYAPEDIANNLPGRPHTLAI